MPVMDLPEIKGEHFTLWYYAPYNSIEIKLEAGDYMLTSHISAKEAIALAEFIAAHIKKAESLRPSIDHIADVV